MRKILFVVTTCILLVLSLSGCTDEYVPPNGNGEPPPPPPPEYWTWIIPAAEWTAITFTYEMITCVGSNDPEIVFASALTTSGKLVIFQEYPPGDWNSWISDRPINKWKHIQPNIPCNVYAQNTCYLSIEKC